MKVRKLFERLEERLQPFKPEPGFDRLGYVSDPVKWMKLAPLQIKRLEEYLSYFKARKDEYTDNPELLASWGYSKGERNEFVAKDIIRRIEEDIADIKDSMKIVQVRIDKGANQRRLPLTFPIRRM